VNRGKDDELLSVAGIFNYQAATIKRSLVANGQIVTKRDGSGSDGTLRGAVWAPTEVRVHNGRLDAGGGKPQLDKHGFELRSSPTCLPYGDFYDNELVLHRYYPECAELVKAATGADIVVAFDHNLRSAGGKQAGAQLKGGSAVQAPASIVHGDYTLTSGPRRLEQLAQPPKANDTLGKLLSGVPVVSAEALEMAQRGRFAIVNVWRNVREEPVEVLPLACCDAESTAPEDLCVFEIHYADRVGENYFAAHAERHRWYYFPRMERDEAMLIKQWDSCGTLTGGQRAPFALHSAFADPTTPESASDRESIEVRCLCIFEDPGPAAARVPEESPSKRAKL